MSESKYGFETANIKYDGDVRGPDDQPVGMYIVETPEGPIWFEACYEFAENGNDFWLRVRNFGFRSKELGGSGTSPLLRLHFSAAEAQIVRARLEALFLGPHDNPNLPVGPFRHGKGKCLGVRFPELWIVVSTGTEVPGNIPLQ